MGDLAVKSSTPTKIDTGSASKAKTGGAVTSDKPAAKTDGAAKTSTTDKTTVSPEAGQKDDPRAKKLADSLGGNFGTSTQKADTWKKGPNDTIEGMLKGKGFTLQDIYKKGSDGKNMVDKVLSANGLKDPKKMRDGQEMVIPDLGSKGGGTSTKGLKEGESVKTKVGAQEAESKKTKDGNESTIKTDNGTSTQVESKGESTNAVQVKPDGSTVGQTVANNEKGKPSVEVTTTTKGENDKVEAKTLDGGTLKGTATPDGVTLQNGTTKVTTDLDERKRDGAVENFGASVDRFFGTGPKEPAAGVDVSGKKVTTTAEGNDVTVSADGKPVAKFNQDADDGFFERGGAVVDKGIRMVGDAASGAVDLAKQAGGAISNAASGLWGWVTGG